MMSGKISLAALALVGLASCADKKAVPPPKSPVTLTQGEVTGPAAGASPISPGVDASVSTSGLHVSDAISRACNLPRPEVKSHFDFDSAEIGVDDRELLAAVAKCLTEGPLRGRSVSLVGRADARGEDEYNMSLGGTRSESVRRYMHDLGVQKEHLNATSRGELDATGTDEASWAQDRRVDIDLVN
jgi:peptidoglycan-associated lipoprotein